MDKKCAVYRTVNIIGKRWTILILLELSKKKKSRYSELKSSLPEITGKILSMRLKELEHEGMIRRAVNATCVPIKCEYSLTKSGQDFYRIIKDVKKWTLKWKEKNKDCEKKDCKDCDL